MGFLNNEYVLKIKFADLDRLGTSFAEAVRIFARQSVQEKAMPFVIRLAEQDTDKRIGIAKGEFVAPDDIDRYNDEIEDMFGGF